MRNRIIIFLFLSVSTACFSQFNTWIGGKVSYSKLDLFVGPEFVLNPFDSPQISFSQTIELGVNRTFYQQRLFPKFTTGAWFDFVRNEKLILGPQIQYAFSYLKINASTNHFTNWNEFYLGAIICYGQKMKYSASYNYGLSHERYYSTLLDKKTGINYSNYSITFSVAHVL